MSLFLVGMMALISIAQSFVCSSLRSTELLFTILEGVLAPGVSDSRAMPWTPTVPPWHRSNGCRFQRHEAAVRGLIYQFIDGRDSALALRRKHLPGYVHVIGRRTLAIFLSRASFTSVSRQPALLLC